MKDEVVENMWHVYSDGTRADIPFNTDEDKRYAWNSVAVCAEIAGVRVWVSTVNDTHLHTVVKGVKERVQRYRDVLQQRLQTHFPGQGIYFACDPIETHDEVLVKFMYVYRNCLDFFKKLPGEYAWGSGNIYFSEKRQFNKGRLNVRFVSFLMPIFPRRGNGSVKANSSSSVMVVWQRRWAFRCLSGRFLLRKV